MRPQKVTEAVVIGKQGEWVTFYLYKGEVDVQLTFEDGEIGVQNLKGSHSITDLTVVYPDPLYWNHHG